MSKIDNEKNAVNLSGNSNEKNFERNSENQLEISKNNIKIYQYFCLLCSKPIARMNDFFNLNCRTDHKMHKNCLNQKLMGYMRNFESIENFVCPICSTKLNWEELKKINQCFD